MKRYIGLAAACLAFAAIIALGNKARAAELLPEPRPECTEFAKEAFPPIHSLFISKMDPAIIKYLIRSTPQLTDTGRWLLITGVEAMELAAAHGKRMSESELLDLASLLCRLPALGAKPAAQRGEFVPPPQDI